MPPKQKAGPAASSCKRKSVRVETDDEDDEMPPMKRSEVSSRKKKSVRVETEDEDESRCEDESECEDESDEESDWEEDALDEERFLERDPEDIGIQPTIAPTAPTAKSGHRK